MAYNGYLIKFGADILPLSYMKADSYKIDPNKMLDLDSYQDQDGILHRTVVDHTATKAEWQSPVMKYNDFKIMMNFFSSKYNPIKERKVSVNYYDFASDSYKTGTFYMPDYAIQVLHASSVDMLIQPVTFKIIEY